MAMQNPDADYLNYNYNYLVIQTIMKMRDAKAEHAKYQYWTYFEFAIQLVLSYLEPGIAAYIQQDFNVMDEKIQAMKRTSGLSDKTREMTTDLLHEEFADRHRYYILKALNKIGIVKVSEDGDIDFGKLDLQVMSDIIKANPHAASVSVSTTEQAMATSAMIDERSAGITNVSAAPTDLTLVVADGKIYKMGSEDYKKYVDTKLEEKIVEAQKVADDPEANIPEKKIETEMPEMPNDLPAIGWRPRQPQQAEQTEQTDSTEEDNDNQNVETADEAPPA